jgi:hypothetical protein
MSIFVWTLEQHELNEDIDSYVLLTVFFEIYYS